MPNNDISVYEYTGFVDSSIRYYKIQSNDVGFSKFFEMNRSRKFFIIQYTVIHSIQFFKTIILFGSILICHHIGSLSFAR